MEAAYRKEADCMIVPMPREVDHHVAGNMSREIDLLAESWHGQFRNRYINRKKKDDGHACRKSDSGKSGRTGV